MSESNPTNQVIYAVDIYDFSHPLQVDNTGALRVTGSFLSSTDVNINQVGGAAFTLGQKNMANSMPVVIASDQSPIAVTGTITTSPNVNVHDGAGNTITSTASALDINLKSSSITIPVSGTVTALQGTSPWVVSGTVTATQSGTWNINNISGTISLPTGAATEATLSSLNGKVTVVNTGAVTISTALPAGINVIGHVITDTGSTVAVSNFPATQPVSGTVTVVQPTGTNLHAVLDSGSTTVVTGNVTVVQPTGTNLHTVVDSGTITLSGTSPVSGTVTANQGTANTPANKWPIEIVDSAGVNIATVSAAGAVKVDGSAVTQPVSGTVTANIGTTNGLALDASVTALQVNQASTTSGQKGTLVQGAVTTAAPTYTTGQTDPLSLTTAGALRVDASGTTQPVSFPADNSPATQNITVVDTGTTTTAGANGQSIYTGTSTAGSTALFTLSSQESVGIQVTGTWTGTLQVESSLDGGTTWSKNGGHQKGVTFNSSSFTANFELETNVSTTTNLRIRATAAITGTATVKIVSSINTNAVYVLNALQVLDGGTTGTKLTIKAASTGPTSTDTAAVVALSPNLPVTISTVGITASSSGDNTLIAAQGVGKKIYVFAWNISFSGTVNAKFTDGAAGTLLSGLYYGIVNAGGGNAVPPPYYLWAGTANTALVLNLSGATAVGGSVSYYVI